MIPERPLEPAGPHVCGVCAWCGGDIEEGDPIADVEGSLYHEDCFRDAAVSLLETRVDVTHGVAEKERRGTTWPKR